MRQRIKERILRVAGYLKSWLSKYDDVRENRRNDRRFDYLLAVCIQKIIKGARLIIKLIFKYFRH